MRKILVELKISELKLQARLSGADSTNEQLNTVQLSEARYCHEFLGTEDEPGTRGVEEKERVKAGLGSPTRAAGRPSSAPCTEWKMEAASGRGQLAHFRLPGHCRLSKCPGNPPGAPCRSAHLARTPFHQTQTTTALMQFTRQFCVLKFCSHCSFDFDHPCCVVHRTGCSLCLWLSWPI